MVKKIEIRMDNQLKALITKYKKTYIDTSLYIFIFNKDVELYPTSAFIVDTLIKQNKPIVSSAITLAELLAKKQIQTNFAVRESIKLRYQNVPNLEIVNVDIYLAELAASLRVKYCLKLPDALHLATAILTECDLFVCGDKHFKKVKEVDVLNIYDLL